MEVPAAFLWQRLGQITIERDLLEEEVGKLRARVAELEGERPAGAADLSGKQPNEEASYGSPTA